MKVTVWPVSHSAMTPQSFGLFGTGAHKCVLTVFYSGVIEALPLFMFN